MSRALAIASEPPRRARLLEAAIKTFLHYGYRKTSMEEVARAAHVSRQGLYLHFATKDELFRAAIRHALETGLAEASVPLQDGALDVGEKLSAAFDAWTGRYVGVQATDLEEAVEGAQASELIAEHEAEFLALVTRAIARSELGPAYRRGGLSARQLAEVLSATARGLKHSCSTRGEFRERFDVAVRALCLPLLGS